MDLANDIYVYELFRSEQKAEQAEQTQRAILEKITESDMAPLYAQLCEKFSWPVDNELLEKMRAKNKDELTKLDAAIEDATKNAGDTEVVDALFAKARHLAAIGDHAESHATFTLLLAKPKVVTGKKIDALMEEAKMALFSLDTLKLKNLLLEAKKLNDQGGDWDRRNRLKIYEALHFLAIRDIPSAAPLLLDCVATFTCTELLSYKQFIQITVITCVGVLDRNELRKKVIKDPHVSTALRDLPDTQKLVTGLFHCDYRAFFEAMVPLSDTLHLHRFLGPLLPFFLREWRVLAFSQFLAAYRSVPLGAMAAALGLPPSLVDRELARFIAAGRLNAKIDKVGDIVETRRPDRKNEQYLEVIKKGDALLNQVQNLVRAIDV